MMTKKATLLVATITFLFFFTLVIIRINTSYNSNKILVEKTEATLESKKIDQNNWYKTAIESITKAEYSFKKDTAENSYYTPNRKNNLRFIYDENGFTAAPRTTKIAIENNDSCKSFCKNKFKHIPNWKVAFNLDKKQTSNGKWNIDADKAEYITDKITVQYINNEEGMRQNFIVASALSNDDALKINFSISTKLKVKLQNNALHFFHKKAGNVLNYSQLKVWDVNNNPLEAHFENDGNSYSINVNAKDAVYPITIDPISTSPSSIMESNQANAQMGLAVSSAGDVNGDGYSDVIVGAYLYDNGQTDEGRAYIYLGSDTGTSATAATILESNQANAQFGIAVSTAGDVNGDGFSDVVIGANLYDNGQTDEGRVSVYHGSATGVNTVAAINLESNLATSNFGISVACAGDVNGDGFSDIITGSNLFSSGQVNEGVAVLYRGSATGIVGATAVILQINQTGAYMGTSVASAGDINGDGFSDVIIGVPLYNGGLAGEGAAVIYTGSAIGINTTVAATLESNQLNANMGLSVSSAGDVNADGYSDVIVGAHLYDKGQTDEGVAFVFHGAAAGIISIAVDTLEANQASANFGRSVSCAGDNNGDGYSDVIVGANLYENGQTDEGAVFVFRGAATGIVNTAIAVLESNQLVANFGITVASAGDVNGDGYSDVIVGTNLFDNGETDEGAAFVYNGSANSIQPLNYSQALASPINHLYCNQSGAYLGYAVSSAGDVNGDGYSDIIAGAPRFDNGSGNEGAAFIYHGSPNGITIVAADTIESNQLNAEMGNAVSSAGDINGDGYSDIIIGDSKFDKGQTDEGVAIVYYGSATGINTQQGDTLEGNQAGANFGSAVSSAGDVNADGFSDILIAGNLYDNGEADEGRVSLFLGSANGIVKIAIKNLEINQAFAWFGFSIASAGDVNGDGYSDVIIGAKLYDNIVGDQGRACIYYGSDTGLASIANIVLDGNSAGDIFGSSVSSAGDVNGDGFSDILVGAAGYDNAISNTGAVYIFHGSALGIIPSAVRRLETPGFQQLADGFFGSSVASAGDVNGDGYSDIIAGAYQYSLSNTFEGRSYVYLGSPAGIGSVAAATLITGMDFSLNGFSVAGAGDINGDGFSDIISGAYQAEHVVARPDEGLAYIYYGNGGELGLNKNFRLYNSNQITAMQQSNGTDPLFGAGLFTKSSLGRQKGKLVIETVKNGIPFSGNPITNSTNSTAIDPTFTNLGLTGVELKRQVTKMTPTKATNIRARVQYDPTTAITGQLYGPWRYSETYLMGNTNKILSATTYNWTGNVSIVWENPANWSSNVVPISTSQVFIPTGRPRYPTIYATTTIKSLSLAPGTSAIPSTGVTLNIIGQ